MKWDVVTHIVNVYRQRIGWVSGATLTTVTHLGTHHFRMSQRFGYKATSAKCL